MLDRIYLGGLPDERRPFTEFVKDGANLGEVIVRAVPVWTPRCYEPNPALSGSADPKEHA